MTSPFASLVITIVLSVFLVGCGDKTEEVKPAPAQTTQSVPEPVQTPETTEPAQEVSASEPVSVETAPAPSTPSEPLSADAGQKRYETTCKVCHGQGLLDAPKTGDKTAWQTRIAKGKDTLYTHSIKGFNKMPAQATGDISEEEVKMAVDYMIEQSS